METLLISIVFALGVGLMVDPLGYYWVKISRSSLKKTLEEFRSISYATPKLDFWLRAWGAAIFVVFLFGIATNRLLLSASLAFVLYVVPKQILIRKLRQRKDLLCEQLISAISVVSNSVKAGLAFEKSFNEVGKVVAAPLGQEFHNMAYEYENGIEFEKVLLKSKERYQFQEYQVFITTVTTNKKTGGEVTDLIDEIKNTLMENQRLNRKLAADTATGRMTINTLTLGPVAFLGMSLMINPSGTLLLFNNVWGQATLLIVTLMTYTGYRWGQKIVSIEF